MHPGPILPPYYDVGDGASTLSSLYHRVQYRCRHGHGHGHGHGSTSSRVKKRKRSNNRVVGGEKGGTASGVSESGSTGKKKRGKSKKKGKKKGKQNRVGGAGANKNHHHGRGDANGWYEAASFAALRRVQTKRARERGTMHTRRNRGDGAPAGL